MKIRLNGSIDLYKDGIDFDDLDIEIIGDENIDSDDYCDCDDEFDELVTLDEYLEEMIEDYVEIIEYTDIDIKEALASMVYELLDLGL